MKLGTFSFGLSHRINARTGSGVILCALMSLALMTATQSVFAQSTFTVSNKKCKGAGSLDEAVKFANANPGSTIKIPSTVTVSLASCRDGIADPQFNINQNTTIEGDYVPLANGDPDFSVPPAIIGPQKSYTVDGNVNTECPSPLDTIGAQSPGVFSFGNPTSNPTAPRISVTIKNMRFEDLPFLAIARSKVDLVIADSFLNEIRNINRACYDPMIEVNDDSNLTLRNTVVNDYYKLYFDPVSSVLYPDGAIMASGKNTVTLDRVKWEGSGDNFVVAGSSGTTTTIVSSWFNNVGGFYNKGGRLHMVNSVWSARSGATRRSPITTSGAGAVTVIEASTLRSTVAGCATCFGEGHPLTAFDGGRVELKGSVIGGSKFDLAGAGAVLGDDLSVPNAYQADENTWIQPSTLQDAAKLRSKTSQPNLLTDPPGIKTTTSSVDYILDVSQPLVPGVLLDIIDNTLTPLINPIDNQPIAVDVFGSPRLDGNRRDAGAVQIGSFNNPSFTITALVTGQDDGQVALSWTRPQDPPGSAVAGYKLQYRESGTTPWLPAANITDPATLQGTVSGLTNGTLYEFQVVPYNTSVVDGPSSNTMSATPFSRPQAPVVSAAAASGEVTLTWTQPDNNGSPLTDYVVFYRETGQSNWNLWPYNNFSTPEVTISGLINGTSYDFQVAALNSAGIGSPGTVSQTPREPLYLSYPDLIGYVGFPLTVYPTYANVYGIPTYTVDPTSLPPGMSFSSTDGLISGTPSASGNYPLTIELTDSASGQSITTSFTITVNAAGGATLTANYDNYSGPAGTALNAPLQPHVTGQTGTLSFRLTGVDPLPAGLSLDSTTGEISGTPTTATGRVFSLEMEIKDDTSTIFEPFNIEIAPTLLYAPVVSEIGDPLSVSPTVSPSVEAGSFTLVSGSLPTGLSLNSSSGAITGTPSETSNTALTIEYTTGQQTVNSQFTLQINGYQPSLTYPPFIGTPGQTVSLNPSLTGTKGAVTYTSGLPLPDGLSLNPATGVISGVVASNAVSAGIEIRVTDQYQQRASAGVVVSIGAASVPVPLLNTLSIFVLGLLISLVGLRRAGLLARFKRAR